MATRINDTIIFCRWLSFDRYACSTELYGRPANKQLDGIGTICHEFSHVLGLPDLYDTAGGESVHPSKWSIMASGSYLNDSRTPCGFSLYERYALDFAKPEVITTVDSYELESLNVSNRGYRIDSSVKNEYFLLENRNKTRWDEYLPGEGLLIFRVDSTDVNVWQNNKVNANPAHNYYTLLRANPKVSSNSTVTDSDGDPFPGSGNITEITNLTSPSLQSWAKVATPLVLKDINITADGDISFRVENEEIPTLTETFEQFPVMESSASKVPGTFTNWTFTKGSKVVEVSDASLGLGTKAVSTIKSAELITDTVKAEVESFSITVFNASSSAAIIRAYYSTNNGASWISVKNLDGTTNPTVAAGSTIQFTYNIGSAKNACYRFVQYSGSTDGNIFFDNIIFNCTPGSLSADNTIVDNPEDIFDVMVDSEYIKITSRNNSNNHISLYSTNGILIASAILNDGIAYLPKPIVHGIYIVRCGNYATKVRIK